MRIFRNPDSLLDPKKPRSALGNSPRDRSMVDRGEANLRCLPGAGNDQNGRTCIHFFAAPDLPSMALCHGDSPPSSSRDRSLLFRQVDFSSLIATSHQRINSV